MPARDNPYSRFVAFLKVVLPLAALGVLSTLFLLSRGNAPAPGTAEPPAGLDVDQLLREQRLNAPDFAGVTRDGTAISLTADRVGRDPAAPARMRAEQVRARMELADGSYAEIVARQGSIDRTRRRAVLEGEVVLALSSGYRVTSERIVAALDETDIVSPGPVSAEGPATRLEAGSMRLWSGPAAEDGYLLDFTDGVKLVYDPNN